MRAVELFEQDDPGELVREGHPAERQPVIDLREVEPEGTPNHEAQINPALAPLLEKAAESHGIELLALTVEQGDERPVGQPPGHVLIVPDLGHLDAGMPGQELVVMLVVVGERLSQPADGDDDDPHGCDTTVG